MSLDQHVPFDAELVDNEAFQPRWLRDEPEPGWHLASGEFPVLTDPALREDTDE